MMPSHQQECAQLILDHLIASKRFKYNQSTGYIYVDDRHVGHINILDYLSNPNKASQPDGTNKVIALLVETGFGFSQLPDARLSDMLYALI